MSAEDLALFLRQKMGELKTNNTEIVRRSNISRRTWYRLLNADIEEAKLSTLVKLSNSLNISVTQLVKIYFDGRGLMKHQSGNGKLVKTNLPRNSLVKANQSFTKVWKIKNQSMISWRGIMLRCIDNPIGSTKDADDLDAIQAYMLEAEFHEIHIPETIAGGEVSISMNFIAPDTVGAVISHWRFFDKEKQLEGEAFPKLDCLVNVVSF